MAIDIAALKAECENNPQSIPNLTALFNAGETQRVADLLNDVTYGTTKDVLVGSRALLNWAASQGALTKIKDAAEDKSHPGGHAIRSLCDAAYAMIYREDTELDWSIHEALFDALVAGGVLTAADKTSIDSTLVQQPSTRGEDLFGGGVRVTSSDVVKATRL